MTDWVGVLKQNQKQDFKKYLNYLSDILTLNNKNIIKDAKTFSDILNFSCNAFIDNYFIKKETKIELNKIFIDNKIVHDFKLYKEINIVTDYFIKNNMELNIKENEKDIIYISILLRIASTINYNLNYFNKDIKVANLINEYINLYTKIDFISKTNEESKYKDLLIKLVNKKIEKETKFVSLFDKPYSFNKYIRINEEKPVYIAQYNYYIKKLEEYDPRPIKSIYDDLNVEDNFTLICLELSMITLLKEIIVKNYVSTYLVPIKKGFFNKSENVNQLKTIYQYDIVKDNINVLINYNELDRDLAALLKRNNINYYIYCDKASTITEFDEKNKYVFSKEFTKKHQLKATGNDVIETLNVYLKDNDILYLKNKESKK